MNAVGARTSSDDLALAAESTAVQKGTSVRISKGQILNKAALTKIPQLQGIGKDPGSRQNHVVLENNKTAPIVIFCKYGIRTDTMNL